MQRLRLVEIYDVKRLQMRYATSTIGWAGLKKIVCGFGVVYCCNDSLFLLFFRGPSTLATFVAVYALFGPTFPGVYDKERGVYALFYPVSN